MPSPSARRESAASDPGRKVHVGFTFSIDENLQQRAPFLLLLVILFVASSVLFAKANFIIADSFDVSRADIVLAKFYSITFILFVIVFSLTLALAAYYAQNLERMQALLVAPATLIPAVLLWLLFPSFLIAFIAFALTLTLAAFLVSISVERFSIGLAGRTISRALLLLALFAVVYVYANVAANQDAYFDQILSSTASGLGGVSGGGGGSPGIAGLCAGAFSGLNLSVSSSAFSISREQVYSAMVLANSTYGTAPPGELREVPLSACTGAIPIVLTASLANLSRSITEQVQQAGASAGGPTPTPSPTGNATTGAGLVRAQALQVPALKMLHDSLALFTALLALGIVTLLNYVLRWAGAGFYWLLLKI